MAPTYVAGQPPLSPAPHRPFEHATGLLVVIPDKIDVEEEARLYEDLCDVSMMSCSCTCASRDFTGTQSPITPGPPSAARGSPPHSPRDAPSVFSRDIWLGDNSGESHGFARSVEIGGWTSVGDKRGGAYVVYDCAIKTKEGTVIHIHRRYSGFAELYAKLRATLPESQQHFIPTLPPKYPLAKFRPTFLDHRRRLLEHWLSSVVLHPDIGGCRAIREWVMD
ncbi:Phox-like protein [Amylocystis lapponica]|nr:Phox-like protein [Amylocystis lapponica]